MHGPRTMKASPSGTAANGIQALLLLAGFRLTMARQNVPPHVSFAVTARHGRLFIKSASRGIAVVPVACVAEEPR